MLFWETIMAIWACIDICLSKIIPAISIQPRIEVYENSKENYPSERSRKGSDSMYLQFKGGYEIENDKNIPKVRRCLCQFLLLFCICRAKNLHPSTPSPAKSLRFI